MAAPESADATGIKKVIELELTKMNINIKKQLVGASADGTSVNFGVKSGVITQFKSDQPSLITVHCTAHRLELALKDAFSGTYFSEVAIYSIYAIMLLQKSIRLYFFWVLTKIDFLM